MTGDAREDRAGAGASGASAPVAFELNRRAVSVDADPRRTLLDVLRNVSNENVECRLNDSNSSALITLPGNERFKYVVMPMRI